MVRSEQKHIWLNAYPEDVPAEIGPLEHDSIGAFFEDAFEKNGNALAHTCMGKSISYKEWGDTSAAMAGWLHSLGLQEGARVAIMLPNILQTPIIIAAVLRAGFTLTCINPLYTPREVRNQLVDSGAKTIILLENFAHTLEKVLSETSVKHICITRMGDMFHGQTLGLKSFIVNNVVRHIKKMVPNYSLPSATSYTDALTIGSARSFTPFKRSHDDLAVLQYTGGTTGIPKAAMISHANVLSNAEQSAVWIDSGVKGKAMPSQLTFLCALPLFHIFSLTVNLMISTRIGGHNLLIPNPRDIPALIKDLRKHKVQIFGGLNTLFNALLNNEDFRKLDFSHDMITASGGMKTQTAVANRWSTVTGSTIKECYGLTETSPVVSGNRFDLDVFTGTIGLPIPSTIVEIHDEKGKALPPGEIGEICIGGPQVMLGYWNMPEETEKIMTKDGMLKTGDIGFMDQEGQITIVDRLKDMILVSGFNVYPNEIEDVVTMLDGVTECAAIGISNKDGNDDIKLFVVKNDERLTDDDVRAHCKKELTNYKRPKFIVFHDELPKSNVGKILRRELRNI
jgi:long-chain acyl-CoA synthetase